MKFHETSEIISRFEKTWNFLSLVILALLIETEFLNVDYELNTVKFLLPLDITAILIWLRFYN